ncbi:MAG: helix-turn-helix domain-containing protein [Planctomycetia bacterium]|nr:helix-turn-helix domain-containing protein [Planctomycetia bacterium]
MVCSRCIRVVKEELEKLGYRTTVEQLGLAIIEHSEVKPDLVEIAQTLEQNGFDLLVDKNAEIVENIKTIIIDLIYQDGLEEMNINLSDYLGQKLSHDYSYLSTLFSLVESITIEKYFILQKIERVRELLIYDELTLSEIAYRLGYSSVQYLSNQFKNSTGMNPSQFKVLRQQERISLEKVNKKSYTNSQ